MATIQELISRKQSLVAELNDINQRSKSKEGFTPELEGQWDKISADLRQLNKQIEREEQLENLARSLDKVPTEPRKTVDGPKKEERTYREIFTDYLRGGMRNLDDGSRAILGAKHVRGTDFQTVGADEHGGYTVPDEWNAELIRTMAYYGGIQEAARTITTSDGRKWNTQRVAYPGGGASAVQKGVLITETSQDVVADITFENVELDAYTMSSRVIKVSYELMADSQFDLAGFIMDIAAERLGRIETQYFTTGSGSSQPQGVVNAVTLTQTSDSATAISKDDILGLVHTVDRAYRVGDKVGFMFNDAILEEIKKLDVGGSGDTRPLWLPSFREGEPDTIAGYQYWVNNEMVATVTASDDTMLFGDFSKFWIRRAGGVQMVRLNELYADTRSVGFFAYDRVDSELMDTNAIAKLEQDPS